MNCKWMGVAVALLLPLGAVDRAEAEPLDLSQVAADAQWVLHVDIDALRESEIVQKAWQKGLEERPDTNMHLDMASAFIGMDPRKDLHGVTAYGPRVGKHEGVLILHADFNKEVLVGMAKHAPEHKVTEHGDHAIHSWVHSRGDHSHPAAGSFHGADRIVFAGSVDDVAAALDVLHSESGGVGGDHPLGGRIPPGTTVMLRVSGIADADLPCNSPVVKQMESFRFVVGEHEGESFYRARAVMTNEAVADQLREIVEGGRALGQLHCQRLDVPSDLVDALRVKSNDGQVTVLWAAPAADVWEAIEFLAPHVKKHIKASHGERHGRRHGRWHGRHRHHHHGDRHKRGDDSDEDSGPSEEDF